MKPYASYKASGVAWLGEVPGHWTVRKMKHLAAMRSGEGITAEDIEENGSYPVYGGNGCRGFSSTFTHDGEFVLIGRQGALCGNVHWVRGQFWASEHAVVSDFYEGDSARWARYLFEFMNLGQYSVSAAQPGLAVDRIQQLAVLTPPFFEQQAIANYLDTETARIDELIREKEGLIGLLGEARLAAIIDHTTGAADTREKLPTGDPFCPALPRPWALVKLGKYARIGNGSTPLKENTDYWLGGEFPWLNSAVVNRDEVTEASELVTEQALCECHLPIVEPGAVLVALTGQGKTRGQVTVLRIQATINQHLAFIALDPEHFDTEYVFWTLTGLYAALRMVSDGQGGTKGALTCEDLSRFPLPKPTLAEQQAIAGAVAGEVARVDELITHTTDEIALLKELRAATIADAVLGRVDVTTGARVTVLETAES